MGNGEALQLHAVYRIFYCKSHVNLYQYKKSRENLYQVLQVTRAVSERAIKSKVCMIKCTKLYQKKYHLLLPLALLLVLRTRNNTDGNCTMVIIIQY